MRSLTLISLLCLLAPAARAANIPCGPVKEGVVMFDGLLGDWKGVRGVTFAGGSRVVKGRKRYNGASDLSFTVMCNYSNKHLYLAFRVTDDFFVRTRRRRGDDHLAIRFGGKTLVAFPGDLKKHRGWVAWGRRRAKKVKMAEALQRDGYSVELGLPLRKVGYRKGKGSIPVTISMYDADWRGGVESILSTGASHLTVAQVQADISAFLRAVRARAQDVRWRGSANVVGGSALEQVVLVKKMIGIVGQDVPGGGYFYVTLPVRRPRDVYWLKLLDLNGDRLKEMVVRYVERSSNGRRGMLAVFRFNSVNRFGRSFAHEILKGQGSRLITNRFTFKRRRRRRKLLGYDIIIDKPKARGFTRLNFHEAPAASIHSIMLPWEAEKKRVFRFEGDQYSQQTFTR